MIVRLRRVRYFWVLPWPLFRRRFSLDGDSGSFAITAPGADGAPGLWLGMIHAADGPNSMVIAAQPLLDYLDRVVGFSERTLTAHRLSED
jgi:hypothetical protein